MDFSQLGIGSIGIDIILIIVGHVPIFIIGISRTFNYKYY